MAGDGRKVGSSRRALEQTLSDSEQPFSPKRQEINPPDCGWGFGVEAQSLQVHRPLVYISVLMEGPHLVLSLILASWAPLSLRSTVGGWWGQAGHLCAEGSL